jgi:hypothetical protein
MESSGEVVEEVGGLGEGGVGVADGFGLGGFEGVVGGDAVEPAVMGELFVIGEVEADEEADVAAQGGGFLLSVFGILRVFGGGFFLGGGLGIAAVGGGGGVAGAGALEFEKDFVAEAEGLFPAFDFVARLLGGGFVGAEIENQEGLGHEDCIAGREEESQGAKGTAHRHR